MAEIRFEKVCKFFDKARIIEDLDLTIQDGKFTVLVGASGCGKTTLLRMIAGIGPATSGHIYMDGRDITDTAPAKRDIAMVFQNYAIYPTMTVRENIEFGLKNKKVPKAEREALIKEYAAVVGLTDYLDRKPGTLSGGQRQRIALARAMVKKPAVFLMDEPLSNLDAKLRVQMRSELIELHNKLKTTFVYVTHDQVEAMSMADVIVLMDKGRIMQEASPEVIYNDPNNVFTAQFIGTPPMNIIDMPDGNKLGFRPERIALSYAPVQGDFTRKGTVLTREMLGSETLYKIDCSGNTYMAKIDDPNFAMGENVYVHVANEHLYFFDAEGQRIREKGNETLFAQLLKTAGGMSNV
ncbi:MAG: ABC transporter ATP-binding protein [Clostridia bacterium]|nr:ABC transporter ATP-binding protein [Clostridia bacterium]